MEPIRDLLVGAKHVANFPTRHADVASRYVRVGANVAVQLTHKGLTEAPDLRLRAALGVKVRPTLATTQGQRRHGVLQDLLGGEELQDTQIDGRVQAQTVMYRKKRRRQYHTGTATHEEKRAEKEMPTSVRASQ